MQIDIDNAEMKRQIKSMKVIRKETPTVFKKAVNSTLSSMKTYTKTEVSKRYTIDKKYVGSKIKTKKITNDLGGGAIYTNDRPTFVNRFEHTPNQRPGKAGDASVFAKVRSDGSGGEIKGAFIAPIKNKNGDNVKNGVFIRTDKKREYKGTNRKTKLRYSGKSKYQYQSLKAVYAPGVSSMMNNKDVQSAVQTKTEKRFDKALDKSIDKVLKKGATK